MPDHPLRSSVTDAAEGCHTRGAVPSVLLVDDDLLNLGQMAGAFLEAGWDTVLAHGGVQGLRRFAAGRFDLVVTEVVMVDKDGIELILAMKAARPTAPILAICSDGRLPACQVMQLAESLGADASLGKPLCRDALLGLASALVEEAISPTASNDLS